jgi:hypothetical protein
MAITGKWFSALGSHASKKATQSVAFFFAALAQ